MKTKPFLKRLSITDKESNSFSYQRRIQKSESLSTSKRGNNSCSKVYINRDFKTKRASSLQSNKSEVRRREREQREFLWVLCVFVSLWVFGLGKIVSLCDCKQEVCLDCCGERRFVSMFARSGFGFLWIWNSIRVNRKL